LPSDDLLSMYLKELKKYPPLSIQEERELALASFHGDINARKKLIERNVRFACKIAAEYKNKGLELHEIICSANEGLCMAAEHFNPVLYDVRFQTYADYRIRQAILKTFTQSPEVRIPAKFFPYMKMLKTLKDTENLTTEQLAEKLGCSVFIAKALRDANNFSFVSADATEENKRETLAVKDSFNLEESVINKHTAQAVRDAIDDLPEKEKDVITRYRGIGRAKETIRQIAKTYNVSSERIRQIERQTRIMIETRLKQRRAI
jgi:RNA polymerase primary sigma factor